MKWSIKIKLPLMVLLVFLLVGFSMLFYYRFYMLGVGQRSIQVNRENLDRMSEEVSQGIGDRYPDWNQMNQYIRDTAQNKKISISVYDPNKKLVFQTKSHNEKMFGMKSHDFVLVDGSITYAVEIESSFEVKDIMGFSIVESFVLFTLAILSIVLVLLVVYLHFDIVKPLSLLQKSFELVGYRKNRITLLPLSRNDEIGDLADKFEKMVKKLDDSYNQQLEMISSISHDLKTPLTSIMGYMERLLVSNIKNEEKKQEYYRIIYQKAEDIEKLIEEFSDYTKNEVECAKLKQEKVDFKKFFLSICHEYADELESYHTEFSYVCHLSEDAYSYVDVSKIRRVLANLISNSLKYASTPVKISLSCSEKKGLAYITVEDNGKGVPEDELSHIFNKFYRVDKSRSSSTGDAGLGLAICKSIVENHNGCIFAFNKPEGGFGITFTLPLVQKDHTYIK